MQALCFSPNIISPILVGLIWVFILDPQIGLINALLRAAGSSWQPQWIGGRVLTPYCVAVIFLWQTLGYNATIFLAGIRGVPRELYEASSIDGASSVRQLRYITLPKKMWEVTPNEKRGKQEYKCLFNCSYRLHNGDYSDTFYLAGDPFV